MDACLTALLPCPQSYGNVVGLCSQVQLHNVRAGALSLQLGHYEWEHESVLTRTLQSHLPFLVHAAHLTFSQTPSSSKFPLLAPTEAVASPSCHHGFLPEHADQGMDMHVSILMEYANINPSLSQNHREPKVTCCPTTYLRACSLVDTNTGIAFHSKR